MVTFLNDLPNSPTLLSINREAFAAEDYKRESTSKEQELRSILTNMILLFT